MNLDLVWYDWLAVLVSVVAQWRIAGAAIERHKTGHRVGRRNAWLALVAVVVWRFPAELTTPTLSAAAVARDLGLGLLLAAARRGSAGMAAKLRVLVAVALIGSYAYSVLFHGEELLPELLVELGPDDTIDELAPLLSRYQGTYEQAFPNVDLSEDEDLAQYYIVRCPPDLLDELAEALRGDVENVDSAERNRVVRLIPVIAGERPDPLEMVFPVDDPLLPSQWYLEHIKAMDVLPLLSRARPARPATVAILDTGVDARHEDLEAVFKASPATSDPQGHGSHCAGLAGAPANNGIGMASLNVGGRFIRITSYAALSASGRGTLESIAQAIIDAAEDGADVISLSLGGRANRPPKIYVDAVEYAHSLNCIVVVSAGNESEDADTQTPANVPGVIVVAAVDQDDRRADFSNSNAMLQHPIAAPGVDMQSVETRGAYVLKSGTSMATPLVAGLLGTMRALRPDLSPDQAWRVLRDTATPGPDADSVGPTINAHAAITAILR